MDISVVANILAQDLYLLECWFVEDSKSLSFPSRQTRLRNYTVCHSQICVCHYCSSHRHLFVLWFHKVTHLMCPSYSKCFRLLFICHSSTPVRLSSPLLILHVLPLQRRRSKLFVNSRLLIVKFPSERPQFDSGQLDDFL